MIEIDPDVEVAAQVFQSTFEAGKLVAIAQELAKLAPALWGRFPVSETAPATITSALNKPEAAIQ